MKRCMRLSGTISMVFMNFMVDLAWGGRFTMRGIKCVKG